MQAHQRGAEARPFDPVQCADIRTQLDTLLTSGDFRLPNRRERLLRYLVDRTLEGEGERINEYSIALDVFERPTEFDPKLDAVVRAEVSRLRQNLKDYYEGAGQADRTVIQIPTRSYAPTIEFREPASEPVQPYRAARLLSRSTLARAAVILLAIGACIAGVALWTTRRHAPGMQSLVVLPFQDLSSNHQSEYLADGLTDEITNDLANLNGLRVIARTSAFEFKGKGEDVRKIGRQLNVEAALEGSLVREGDRIRIRAQLNRTSDGSHLWSHAYDIDAHDLIGVQQQIAQSIADDLEISRGQNALDAVRRPRRFTTDPQAHDLYLRGMQALNATSAESFRQAAGFFQSAIDKDPSFAMAWLGLARAHDSMSSEVAPGVSYQQVGAEARHALDLDPQLAEAHETLAIIAWERDHDWPLAEREFRLATAGNGSASAHSHAKYAFHLAERGRFAESHQHLQIAQGLSPLEVLPFINEARVFFYEHRFADADRAFHRVLESHPDNAMALEGLGHLQTMLGNCGAGGEYAAKLTRLWPGSFLTRSVLWNLSVCQGDVVQARKLLDQAAPKIPPFYAAASYAVLGDKERALAYLDKAVSERDILATSMKVNPYLDLLHSDPRFAELERRAGLDP